MRLVTFSRDGETRLGAFIDADSAIVDLTAAGLPADMNAFARYVYETVTHFKPEPWLVALAHEKSRMPVKLRGLPEANK